jgi:tetratricopeptide (TPR) repeat protein
MIRLRLPAFSVLTTFVLCFSSLGFPQSSVPRMGEIRGQIRLPNGRPAPSGIFVTLEMRGGGGAAGQVQADQSGKFEFRQIPLAIYEVHVRAQGYQEDFQEANLNMMPQTYVNFVLKPDSRTGAPAVPPGGPAATVSAIDPNVPDSARKDFEAAAELLQSGKDFDKGVELLKKATKEYPQYSQAYVVMGIAYSSKQSWSDAEQALQAAVKANAKNPVAYLSLGVVKNETKNYEDATKYLLKAVELSPESPDAHFELGRTYYALQKWQLADAEFTKAIHFRPDNAEQHLLMGNVLLRERNAPAALKEFQEAVRLDPQGPMAEPTKQMIARIETALQQSQQAGAQRPN